jgi:hypothetical protein
MFLSNIGVYLLVNTASESRRATSLSLLPWGIWQDCPLLHTTISNGCHSFHRWITDILILMLRAVSLGSCSEGRCSFQFHFVLYFYCTVLYRPIAVTLVPYCNPITYFFTVTFCLLIMNTRCF